MRTVCGESRKLAVSTTGLDSIATSFGCKRTCSVIGSQTSRDDPVNAFVLRGVARVPERVRDAARLEHEVARLRDGHLVADLDADLALEHVAVLVLVGVRVHRRRDGARRARSSAA